MTAAIRERANLATCSWLHGRGVAVAVAVVVEVVVMVVMVVCVGGKDL